MVFGASRHIVPVRRGVSVTAEQIAKMQAGRAAALAAKQAAVLSEDDWHETVHIQAYLDLLRYREENEARRGEHCEPSFLIID